MVKAMIPRYRAVSDILTQVADQRFRPVPRGVPHIVLIGQDGKLFCLPRVSIRGRVWQGFAVGALIAEINIPQLINTVLVRFALPKQLVWGSMRCGLSGFHSPPFPVFVDHRRLNSAPSPASASCRRLRTPGWPLRRSAGRPARPHDWLWPRLLTIRLFGTALDVGAGGWSARGGPMPSCLPRWCRCFSPNPPDGDDERLGNVAVRVEVGMWPPESRRILGVETGETGRLDRP